MSRDTAAAGQGAVRSESGPLRSVAERGGALVVAVVDRVNALQDALVERWLAPHAVTATYWSLAAVFCLLGLQKLSPHRASADAHLATVGGLVGIPYAEALALVGAWQLAIGLLFAARRLRICGVLFVAYQVFTFSTLIVLRYVAFQPPWLTVAGVEVPWALGAYGAFVLKNLVFAAAFFVLVAVEVDPAGGRDDASAAGGPGRLRAVLDRIRAGQDALVRRVFRPHGVTLLYLSFAVVFFTFGVQKPAPVYSPVRLQLSAFFPHFSIPLAAGMLFVGTYEMFLGLLFALRQLRAAFSLFYAHQAVTFLSLAVIPRVAFQPPWFDVLGVPLSVSPTGYGEFVLKNLVFVAGFTLLVAVEFGYLGLAGESADTRGGGGS